MGKIKASLADVKTEFEPIPPGIYTFEIEEVDEKENGQKFSQLDSDDLIAYIVKSRVQDEGDAHNRIVSDYINIRKKDGSYSEAGLAGIKRYFEGVFGKDEIAGWSDDDYDTDALVGRRFKGQVKIDSYTPQGDTEPRLSNKFVRIDQA